MKGFFAANLLVTRQWVLVWQRAQRRHQVKLIEYCFSYISDMECDRIGTEHSVSCNGQHTARPLSSAPLQVLQTNSYWMHIGMWPHRVACIHQQQTTGSGWSQTRACYARFPLLSTPVRDGEQGMDRQAPLAFLKQDCLDIQIADCTGASSPRLARTPTSQHHTPSCQNVLVPNAHVATNTHDACQQTSLLRHYTNGWPR